MSKDSLVNHRLNGYFIESLLGRGGMARVYRGVDLRLQRYVAIKVIDAPFRENPDAANRFAREAQVIAQLGQHPDVVQLYHYGEDQGYLFIAMQYIDGTDLSALLRTYRQDNERMPFDDILAIAHDVANALDYIHSRDVIHRDLKPSNIMIDRNGRAILTDFGLALLTDVGTLGEVFGSPAYIAPEQAVSSAEARPESDIYALGVILFEMITGQQPFSGRDPLSVAMKHVQQPAPAPSSVRRGLSPEIDRVILHALAKNPDERYHSARALVDDLEQSFASVARPAAPPATLTHLTIPDRVRLQLTPLPPPTTPPTPAPAPATEWGVAGESWREPAPGWNDPYAQNQYSQPGDPGANRPMVIPAPARSRSPWPTVARVVGLILLLVILLCVGGGLALRSMLASRAGLSPFPSSPAGAAQASTPLPSGAAPLAPTHTPKHAPTQLPTQLPSELPSEQPTQAPPEPPTEVPAEPATPTPVSATLVFERLPQDHLLISNTGDQRLLLAPLVLGQGQDAIEGSELGPKALDPGECIVIVYPTHKPKLPNNPGCDVLEVIGRNPETGFWVTDNFTVLFDGQPVGECKQDEQPCTVHIPIQ